MKNMLFAFVGLVLVGAFVPVAASAAENEPTNSVKKVKLPRGMKRYGGIIVVPGSQKGTIGIFNSQTKVPLADLRSGMDDFAESQRLSVKFIDLPKGVTPKTAAAEMKREGVQVAVFLTECDECSIPLLCAPENRWSIVNVAELTKDAKNGVFAAARVRKELMRGFLCAAGAMNSQYEESMMKPIVAISDLDKMLEDPPIDAIGRAVSAMKVVGVTPTETTTYKKACIAGWAPKPTNEFQQAIWDEVHAAPTSPIVIKPETVKQK